MTRTREKLIKIVLKSVRGCDRLRAGEIADRIIAEGVTVQECKVGDVVYWNCMMMDKLIVAGCIQQDAMLQTLAANADEEE